MLIKQGKINIKSLFIAIILVAVVVGGGIFYQQIKCFFKGGNWGQWGLFPRPFCNIRYSDGGMPCTDSDQCQGNCITAKAFMPGEKEPEEGICEYHHQTFGCYGIFEDGKVSDAICAD